MDVFYKYRLHMIVKIMNKFMNYVNNIYKFAQNWEWNINNIKINMKIN